MAFLRLYRDAPEAANVRLPALSDAVAPAVVAPTAGADSGAGTPAHAIRLEFSPLQGGSVKGVGRSSSHRGGWFWPMSDHHLDSLLGDHGVIAGRDLVCSVRTGPPVRAVVCRGRNGRVVVAHPGFLVLGGESAGFECKPVAELVEIVLEGS